LRFICILSDSHSKMLILQMSAYSTSRRQSQTETSGLIFSNSKPLRLSPPPVQFLLLNAVFCVIFRISTQSRLSCTSVILLLLRGLGVHKYTHLKGNESSSSRGKERYSYILCLVAPPRWFVKRHNHP
jgi:hypothetical protein